MSCKKHPRYTAQRKPRVDCFDCWAMYGDTEKLKCYEEGAAAAEAAATASAAADNEAARTQAGAAAAAQR